MIEKKLTVLVPLKDRHDFTKRFIKFIIKFNLKYHFLFADGSNSKLPRECLNLLKSSKIKFKYIRFKKDKNIKIFFNKLYLALLQVRTDYVMLFDNDDLPIQSTINYCLKKLEKNKKLSGCGGYKINFNFFEIIKNKKINNEYYGNPINISNIDYGNNYIFHNSTQRLKSYLTKKKSINTINDVFRSHFLRNNIRTLKKRNFTYLAFYNVLLDFLNIYNGRVLKINLPFLFHQINSLSFSKKETIYEKISNKKYLKDKKNFINFVKYNCKSNRYKIIKYLNIYFSKIENRQSSKNFNKYNLLDSLKKISFLKNCYQNLKNIYLSFFNKELSNFLKRYDNNSLKLKKIFNFLKKD